jgi:tetratricopeptide (TPR) repeat protein
MSVNETGNTENFAWNRQVYQRLKAALGLGLRRQIFVAVCDDLNLRNQIAARLHSTLAYPVGQVLYQSSDDLGSSTPAYPRLVTLRLNLSNANPIIQINQWLANYPPPVVGISNESPGKPLPVPSFQIVGIEQLTRQPVAVQRLFLQSLRSTEQLLATPDSNPFLESSLLVWVSRPWLYAIQQSAPQFWRCRTGLFVFAGEPTPMSPNQTSPEIGFRGLDKKQTLTNTNHSINNPKNNPKNNPVLNLPKEIGSQDTENNSNNNIDFPLQEVSNESSSEDKSSDISNLLDLVEPISQNPIENKLINNDENIISDNVAEIHSVNKEITELVLATINTTIGENDEDNWRPQKVLEEIEEAHKQENPQALANAYLKLGNLYRERIEEGDSTLENLMVAILAYQEAITYDESSNWVPDILNDLGTLYWMLYKTPPNSEDGRSYIEQGIEFYQLGLRLISSSEQSDTYTRLQNNLGTAYSDLAKFVDPLENWQQAVLAYSEALRYRSSDIEPLKYAATQNNLGTAYWHLAQYNLPIQNLKEAITAYSQALLFYSPDEEPIKYGMIQNNIGTAHWNLAQYETPEEHLNMAINAYTEALKYRTPINIPTACAATQNNLGTAYWHLANLPQTSKELKQKYLKLSVEAYEEALALAHSLTGVTFSFDIYATHNNLAQAYYQIVIDPYFSGDKVVRSRHLEVALENHLQALNGFNKQSENYQNTIAYVIKTVRGFHNELGIQGQNLALSKIPAHLLPEILPKL